MNRRCLALCFFLALCSPAFAQQSLQPTSQPSYIMQPGNALTSEETQKDIVKNAQSYPAPAPSSLPSSDASISVRQAGVECAIAQKVEEMGREHQMPGRLIDSVFKAGTCAGKVQTFMLIAQAQYPSCFPKISLDEGISVFVKWAASHNEAADESYIFGMNSAFTEAVPCMKR